jgi:hypothetical protein
MNIKQGLAIRKSISNTEFDISKYYFSSPHTLSNTKPDHRRPNFLERWRQERRIREFENSEIRRNHSSNPTQKTRSFVELRSNSHSKSVCKKPEESARPVTEYCTNQISPVKVKNFALKFPENGFGRSKSDFDEVGILKDRVKNLSEQLTEACELIRSEREKVQKLSNGNFQLEEIVRKIGKKYKEEKNRAQKLEEELISRSNRKDQGRYYKEKYEELKRKVMEEFPKYNQEKLVNRLNEYKMGLE